jgi:hypothetical protein
VRRADRIPTSGSRSIAGKVVFDGIDLARQRGGERLRQLCWRVQLIFQDPIAELLFVLFSQTCIKSRRSDRPHCPRFLQRDRPLELAVAAELMAARKRPDHRVP